MNARAQSRTLLKGQITHHTDNTITSQLIQQAAPGRVVQLAQALGVRESKLDPIIRRWAPAP